VFHAELAGLFGFHLFSCILMRVNRLGVFMVKWKSKRTDFFIINRMYRNELRKIGFVFQSFIGAKFGENSSSQYPDKQEVRRNERALKRGENGGFDYHISGA